MRLIIFCIGIFALKSSEGATNNFVVKNAVSDMRKTLVDPLLTRTKNADIMLSEMRKLYDNKISLLDKKISLLGKSAVEGPDPDSCMLFKESLDKAQGISNKAAVLALHVVADLTDILMSSEDCLTIWIPTAINCSAHKLKDVKDTYGKYSQELKEVDSELVEALKTSGKEFVSCFKRVN
uniref:Uncharacterized protein n=1 Tax=Riptortus pedestris TaxID=329032 RepID=R4WSY8_RIPPE|nr:unknown secreted protein [Riptortus pedestris]